MSANQDVEMKDVEDEEEDEDEVASDLNPDEGSYLSTSSYSYFSCIL